MWRLSSRDGIDPGEFLQWNLGDPLLLGDQMSCWLCHRSGPESESGFLKSLRRPPEESYPFSSLPIALLPMKVLARAWGAQATLFFFSF